MASRSPLLPSPQLLSSPMLPTVKYDYFHHSQDGPAKKLQYPANEKKRSWQGSSDDTFDDARHAYLTPDPSSQISFSSPPQSRRPLSSIPILRPKVTGEPVTIGRSSVRCTHPIPQQWLNLHISRVHVIVTFLPSSGELSVQCRGLNPIYVDTPYETSKIEKGGEMTFQERDIKINIAGYVVIVERVDFSEDDSLQSSLPLLDPPVTTTFYDEPEKKSQSIMESSPPAMTSPLSHEREVAVSSPPQIQGIQIYHDELGSPSRSSLSPAPEITSPIQEVSNSPSPAPSDSAVLDALLTTLIFAEVKPTPLPRLVTDLSHRMPNVQQDQINSVLTGTPCIGIVHRSGKDAAGKELSDEYYYIAENDDNEARRERYYQFARPTRSCRLKHSQYHWKPVKLHSHKTAKTAPSAPSSPGKENIAGGKRKKAKRENRSEIVVEREPKQETQ